MKLEDLNADYRGFVADLLRRKARDPHRFCTEISAADEMFNKAILPGYANDPNIALFKYIESALRMFDVYQQIVQKILGGFASLQSTLDFGSGYGRLTRSLVQHVDRQRIWVADIYPNAVAWQAETFGVNALVSVRDPDRFAFSSPQAIVFVGSVFSHLPDALFGRWLRRLFELVGPRGVMIFSVHDEALLPKGNRPSAGGLSYLESSESDSLGTDVYGMTYVTEPYVARQIERCDPSGNVHYRKFHKGLYENQDLYVVAGRDVDLSALDLRTTPLGGFEHGEMTNDEIVFSGWAIDPNPGHGIRRCEAFLGEERVAVGRVVAARNDLLSYYPGLLGQAHGWTVRLGPRARQQGVPLRIEMESSTGAVGYCYASLNSFARTRSVIGSAT